MFGSIVYLDNNFAHIEIPEGVPVSENLMNLHVIFEDESKKILGEVADFDRKIVKVRFLGEIVNGRFVGGVIRKPTLQAKLRIINKEELGLIVGVLIILGYGFILFRIYRIAKKSENLRCSVLAYGTFWYLALHILINLLGVLALIPLTGVPLPLLSYGGSFTINALLMLFVVQRDNIENNINRTNREIKAL